MAKLKGFTLTEILIVVLILGILTTIAIPMLEGMAIKAKLTKIILDVNQIEKALDLFMHETSMKPGDGLGNPPSGAISWIKNELVDKGI